MLSRSNALTLAAIILLSGLSFVFLTGQDYSSQAGLCEPDPCANIPNAAEGTCTEFGGSCTAPSDFFCSCDPGYDWQDATNTCEGGPVDPCDPDPCKFIEGAVPDSCVTVGPEDFTCECDPGLEWSDSHNRCIDVIRPIILTCYHPPPVDALLNSVNGSNNTDGIWSVGDTPDPTPPDWVIECTISEPLDIEGGIWVDYDGGTSCTVGSLVVQNYTLITFSLICNAGTVQMGDSIRIQAHDFAGNTLTPFIVMQEVGRGTNIDPIP